MAEAAGSAARRHIQAGLRFAQQHGCVVLRRDLQRMAGAMPGGGVMPVGVGHTVLPTALRLLAAGCLPFADGCLLAAGLVFLGFLGCTASGSSESSGYLPQAPAS